MKFWQDHKKRKEVESRVESVFHGAYDFEWGPGSVSFFTEEDITLKALNNLSNALGTEAINFNLGREGEPGFSSWTPGVSGGPGRIQVFREDWK